MDWKKTSCVVDTHLGIFYVDSIKIGTLKKFGMPPGKHRMHSVSGRHDDDRWRNVFDVFREAYIALPIFTDILRKLPKFIIPLLRWTRSWPRKPKLETPPFNYVMHRWKQLSDLRWQIVFEMMSWMVSLEGSYCVYDILTLLSYLRHYNNIHTIFH